MKPIHIGLIVIATLLFVDFVIGIGKRKEFTSVTSEFQGAYVDPEGQQSMVIRSNSISVTTNGNSESYRVEKSIYYQDGPLFLSNIFGKRGFAIVCDRESSLRQIDRSKYTPPDDYQKSFYLSMPDENGEIKVEETEFMSKGHSGSEGVYTWLVGYFSRR